MPGGSSLSFCGCLTFVLVTFYLGEAGNYFHPCMEKWDLGMCLVIFLVPPPPVQFTT